MNKTFIILVLGISSSIANINSPSPTSSSKSMNTLIKPEIITREMRILRNVRKNREVRKIESFIIREVPSLRLARVNRQIRENRFITQTIRENRQIRHTLIQDKVHFAHLK